ncbi:RNA polymerase sigma factor [Paenibacillus alginolyticus]|uniref:Sigma-70 family RNA polymerase sigma factor n=1 Tax=Paenibacillus alginolyticus TaxID=59839 RepID=A0ABT4G5M6_9BACL|nr:sigma-70 family RNA polymerase sigma factor [Paenibacillus alginolyticus]MCY9691474.1 sigma-70 family RNA polymerase sigma factor [Paenibacillus alginolyticus]MEC0146584.1 sigma-70 family RNA polymerase sigma factor [Paenibacillus alginolyticus]
MDQELYGLISRAKTGDKEAFALLVKRYKDTVFRYSYGMLADRMEAEDVSQEAFIKAYYSLSNLDNIYAFSSWLKRIVSNLCYDRIQKQKKNNTVSGEFIETHISNNDMERTDLHMTIEEAMNKLSPEHREAIILRDVEGYSYDEIAAMLTIPLGTVKSRISAARLLLRKEMKREMED